MVNPQAEETTDVKMQAQNITGIIHFQSVPVKTKDRRRFLCGPLLGSGRRTDGLLGW
jgi:hypothetical protein